MYIVIFKEIKQKQLPLFLSTHAHLNLTPKNQSQQTKNSNGLSLVAVFSLFFLLIGNWANEM